MKTLADRLNSRLNQLKMSQERLALEVGVSQTTISKISKGETSRSRYLPEIARVLQVSEQWLIFGEEAGNAIITQEGVNEWDSSSAIPDDIVAVPFFKDLSLSAGHGALNSATHNETRKLWFAKSFLRRMNTCKDKVFCVTVSGDSMEPRYDAGGVVMVDTLPQSIIDGKVYAISHDGEDYIKYLRRLPNNKVLISSENPMYSSYEKELSEINIIGRVICYQREE